MKFSSEFFTAGELAQLTGISKQLLIYYDKNKIFSPAFIAENGYRYYSLHQYYILEILITLRKMGFSLPEIREYISNRGIDNLSLLYKQKIQEYSGSIADLRGEGGGTVESYKKLFYDAAGVLRGAVLLGDLSKALELQNSIVS